MDLYPVIFKNSFMEIRLENHTLPTPPLTITEDLEINKRYYPGNPEPVVHVLNRKHNEIEISGTIKDYRERIDGFAENLITRLNDMKDAGELTLFEYASQMFNGLITQVSPSIFNMRQIGYKIKFEIFSRIGEKKIVETIPVVKQIPINDLEQQIEETSTLIDSIKDISSAIKFARNSIRAGIQKIKDALNLDEINEVISLANTVLVDTRGLIADIRSISLDTFIDRIYIDAIQHNLVNMRKELFDITRYNHSEPQFITHIVCDGESIYSIARKYNKTWEQIADFNVLSSLTVTTGQKLVIPL